MLYAGTIFLGAFLLFQVQPIVGKLILPWFGGSAAVWSVCLLFFQLLLLLGYLYAHWLTRCLAPRTQALLHVGLLALSLATLPLLPNPAWKPLGDDDPTWLIVGLLAATVGLPYFVLSTTGPLVQAWFAREVPGQLPYRLFALSNFGSMLGLLSYPVLFEPWFALPQLSLGWSAAYAGFALICALLAWRARRSSAPPDANASGSPHEAPPRAGDKLLWTCLAACAAILLMAVTGHVTRDVAPVPFLWVLPLGLYLLSFILCFEGRAWYRRVVYLPPLLAWLAVVNVDQIYRITGSGLWPPLLLYCGGLFVACMACHGELARLKPPARHMTSFYLMLATGGASGGVFVALIAPRIFDADYELRIAVIAAAVAILAALRRGHAAGDGAPGSDPWQKAIVFTVTLVSLLTAWGSLQEASFQTTMARNFYGTLRISEAGSGEEAQRKIAHGVILHGAQYRDPARRRWPTTYFGKTSGGGIAILATRREAAQRVGVVGLGAGTLASYGRAGDTYRFYEINPLVMRLAASEFTFLSDSPATIELVLGDARLSLEREAPQGFDVLVIDAFSSDAIPVHLLTREVFQVYLRHLKPDGVLAVHVSNNMLDLAPVVKLAADYYGREARRVDSVGDSNKGTHNSNWILVGGRADAFDAGAFREQLKKFEPGPAIRPWTDAYSSLYAIMR